MKTYLYIFGLFLLFSLNSCATANYYLKQGNYEAAIQTAAAKLKKNPRKADKHILALEQAWNIEQNATLNTIEKLQLEGRPENWVTIHKLYEEMDFRQQLIAPILPLFIKKEFRNADIELLNINEQLADTKLKAAQFLYAKGEKLLATNNKQKAREAYNMFEEVENLYGSFQNVDELLDISYQKGQNHILLQYKNGSNMIIPQEFMNNLQQINYNNLNGKWTKFSIKENEFSSIDYTVEILINQVQIGPEQVRESQYRDTREVQDGVRYVYDENGNVAKDSLGNDIKEPNMIIIAADVLRVEQNKAGTISGVVRYKNNSGTIFQTIPFREDLVFQNFSATFKGNKNALSAASKRIIGGNPVPFPSDIQMVMNGSDIVKNTAFTIVASNKQLVTN